MPFRTLFSILCIPMAATVLISVSASCNAQKEQRLFKPIGMNDSGLFSDKIPLSNFALDYHRTPEKGLEKPPRIDPSLSYSAAGIYSTADDLYRFDRELFGEQLLTAEMRNKMMTPPKQDGDYAYGWGLENWTLTNGSSLRVSFHSGSVPGYQTYYLRSETNQDCVIILNSFWQGSLVIEMGRELMHVLNGKKISLARSSFSELLAQVAHVQGHKAMVAVYNELADQRADYDVTENAMNSLGNKFLRSGRMDDAIKVSEWNTELYPRSANTHDSLGQVYRSAGRIEDAIRSYETALAIDPQSQRATNALKEMNTDGRKRVVRNS